MSQLFELVKSCAQTRARAGTLVTPHGSVPTPLFMPVGSQGAVKALAPDDLRALGAGMVLANTYHLYLRPGIETVTKLGGLHRFMSWDGPILTDSGGFQVFSMGHLRRISDEGALFRSHIDGSEHFLTPELAIEFQAQLGADIAMVLDECPPYGDDFHGMRRAMERTHLWAQRCRTRHRGKGQALFGIVQGGVFAELRRQSAVFITSLDFAGYGIGGLSLGEPKEVMHSAINETVGLLPEDRPRYLMGVGSPEDLVACVAQGIDMFDSALPTRLGRNGAVFSETGRLDIGNARFREEKDPIEPGCDCYTCRNFSAGYLHHLFLSRELLSYRLTTIHNLRFTMRLMAQARQCILDGTFAEFKDSLLKRYQPTDADARAEQKKKWLESRRGKPTADG